MRDALPPVGFFIDPSPTWHHAHIAIPDHPHQNELEVFDMMLGGMGWGAGMGLGWIFMILFWVFLIAGTVWLVLAVSGQVGRRQGDERRGALWILEERLARGEIDVDEYTARKGAIGGH